MYDLNKVLQAEMNGGRPAVEALQALVGDAVEISEQGIHGAPAAAAAGGLGAGTPGNTGGGYPWSCGGYPEGARTYLGRKDVMAALHISDPGQSSFSYHSSGPASVTLHPSNAKKLRVLIYNGDADACVPYKGNEEWISSLVKNGAYTVILLCILSSAGTATCLAGTPVLSLAGATVLTGVPTLANCPGRETTLLGDLTELAAWQPWYNDIWPGMPAGCKCC
eukprot:SAG22_NODE_944_length_6390_cov_3.189795_4_plen_222_part_00